MYRDMRRDFINSTPLRNDIKIFKFNADAYSYGSGYGEIIESHIEDVDGKALAWVVGGETVRLKIKVQLSIDVPNLLFGFSVKDRLGQNIFGDNSYLTFVDFPLYGTKNEVWAATFTYQMPTLPIGEYSVDLTFGSGTQENHVIHHWMRDAIIFNSHASSTHMGLIGIPMQNISAAPIKVCAKQSDKGSL
jgi:lipopolysaccharide transport system ATP-binding protein